MFNSFLQFSQLRYLFLLVSLMAINALLLLPTHAQDRQNKQQELFEQATNAMQIGNYAIAYCLWQPLADDGDAEAQFNIGWMFHNGYGLRIDDEMALNWWLRAASSGHIDALFALGDLYQNGQGVDQNEDIALGWYIAAALHQHEQAQETLIETIKNQDTSLTRQVLENFLQNNWQILGNNLEVGVNRANTRLGPDKSFRIVATLDRGHKVVPIREQNGWTQVGITGSGQIAWIFSGLLSKPADLQPQQ